MKELNSKTITITDAFKGYLSGIPEEDKAYFDWLMGIVDTTKEMEKVGCFEDLKQKGDKK